MAYSKQIADVLDQLRGIHVKDVSLDNKDTWEVTVTAQCQHSLQALIACENSCPIWTSVHCFNHAELEYVIYFEYKILKDFLSSIALLLKNNNDLEERIEVVPQYQSLNEPSKRKYLEYIKYLRTLYVDGHADLSAKDLLDLNRYCNDCGRELYCQDDEIRTILEFDDPERIHEVLESIVCENDEGDFT